MKAYLTLNTLIYENELNKVETIIKSAKKSKIDAIIAFDFAIIQLCKKHKVKFHISTQMSIANSLSAKVFQKLGAERIVLARECSFKDLLDIKKKTKVQMELFIHGAMCFSLSGRCYLSLFLHNKSANRGECTQPCRRKWILEGFEDEKNKPVEIYENTIMSSKDLCVMPFFDKLLDAKFKYFKIEGRTKPPEYIYTVTKAYKTAVELWKKKKLTENAKNK
jgi:putative protease